MLSTHQHKTLAPLIEPDHHPLRGLDHHTLQVVNSRTLWSVLAAAAGHSCLQVPPQRIHSLRLFPCHTLRTDAEELYGYGHTKISMVDAATFSIHYSSRALPAFTFQVSRLCASCPSSCATISQLSCRNCWTLASSSE